MPVTPAHAAAAWPLHKWLPRLPLSALVIGAMSPDYEYFLQLAPITRVAHTASGLLFFCVPISLIVWFVFRRVVRPALVQLLPPGLARALGSAAASWPLALVAVALGAVSHVAWDGFTHQSDWAVRAWPVLRTSPWPALLPLPWFKLLQYSSSIFGMLALAIWIGAWVRSQPAAVREWAPGQRARAIRVIAIVLVVSAICGVGDSLMTPRHAWPADLGRGLVGAMVGCTIAVLTFALTRARSTRGSRSAPTGGGVSL
jgi:Domain of unknown function (DUF4184)